MLPAEATTTIRSTTGDAASASRVQASIGRPAIGDQHLVDPVHPPRCPGGDDDDVGQDVGRPGPAQSRRGWAKIIRPATVCRTRVTDTSSSRSI